MNFLDLLASDVRPIDTETREVVFAAVAAAAAEHRGLVTIAWVRPHLPRWARWQGLGSHMNALVTRGVLVWTGAWEPNGDASQRNASKPAKVYRFHPEAVTA